MQDRAREHFEEAVQKLHDGLSRKGTVKKYGKIMERIGRLREKYPRAAQHYHIDVDQDPTSGNAIALHWRRVEKSQSQATHPGVYALRTNLTDWDETTLWQTYTLLTDLEAVFRSLKTELGLHLRDPLIIGAFSATFTTFMNFLFTDLTASRKSFSLEPSYRYSARNRPIKIDIHDINEFPFRRSCR